MKYLFGIFLCLAIWGVAAAQQKEPLKNRWLAPAPAIKPTAAALMKSQLEGDQPEVNRQEYSVEELKKTIEREIAKSVSMLVVTSIQELNARIILPIVPPEIRGASGRSSTSGETTDKIERTKEKISPDNENR